MSETFDNSERQFLACFLGGVFLLFVMMIVGATITKVVEINAKSGKDVSGFSDREILSEAVKRISEKRETP